MQLTSKDIHFLTLQRLQNYKTMAFKLRYSCWLQRHDTLSIVYKNHEAVSHYITTLLDLLCRGIYPHH